MPTIHEGVNYPIRPLTAQEEIYWQLTYTDQIHPVLAAHLDGVASVEEWRRALDALQQRHPLLNVSIEIPDNSNTFTQPFFVYRNNKKITLRVVPDNESADRWESEIERQLSLPFRSGDAPLVRAALIQKATSSIFILAVCHSICDGISLSFLMQDLLSHIAGEALAPLEFPLSVEELLRIPSVAPSISAVDIESTCSLTTSLPSVESFQFDEELTKRLVEVTRMNNTTVQGALAAALAQAMRSLEFRFAHEPVRIISPVNVRSVLGAKKECGMYFTSPKTTLRPEIESFWDMARETRQDINEALTLEYLNAVTYGMQQMTSPGLTKAAAANALDTVFSIDVLLTNLGRTPFGSIFGKLKLESLWPAVLAGSKVQTIGATTTNGRLSLLLTSRQPIKNLLMTVHEILLDVCKAET